MPIDLQPLFASPILEHALLDSDYSGHTNDVWLVRYTQPYDFPVLTQVDFGHTDPQLTLPLGVRASLDAGRDAFAIVDTAVV